MLCKSWEAKNIAPIKELAGSVGLRISLIRTLFTVLITAGDAAWYPKLILVSSIVGAPSTSIPSKPWMILSVTASLEAAALSVIELN